MDATEKPSLIKQAAAWLAALDTGTADPRCFEAWRDADPRHAAAFAQVAATWKKLDDARSLATSEPSPEVVHANRAPALTRRRVLQAASVAAAVALGGVGSRVWARSSAETAVGERRTILWDDETRLDLNTDTSVEWQVRAGRRHVWLERGEIALDVAAARSELALTVGDIETLLAPGRYNARAKVDAFDVLVLSGRSAAVEGATPATAITGQRLAMTHGQATAIAASQNERERADGWRRGEIMFAGEPLEAAVAEYNRYLTRKLIIGDPHLRSVRLGGRFTSNDPGDFLAALSASFDIVAERRATSTVLLSMPKQKNRGLD